MMEDGRLNIAEPYARLLSPASIAREAETEFSPADGMALLRRIEWCARISHRSEDADPDTLRFLRSVVLGHGDWSVVEHASASVEFTVDRGITHEMVRHRIASPTQESTRFVNYAKKLPPSFIYPVDESGQDDAAMDADWLATIEACERGYQKLVAKGWTPQRARSVFPNALSSKIVETMNLRSWRHFLLMRTTKEAHPQMRQVTVPLLAEFKAKIPVLFEDIEPLARQADNLKKGR